MRVLTLLARYGSTDYAGAAEKIVELFRNRVPTAEHSMVVVDNALPPDYLERTEARCTVIGGDNAWHEFSAWDRAIRWCEADLERFDVIHLATSAFDMLYNAYLQRFDAELLHLVSKQPIAAGHIDYYPQAVRFGNYVSQNWLRSSFIFLAPGDLLRLRGLVTFRDRTALFSGNPARPFLQDGTISPGYQKLILDWLTSSEGTGQGTAWHSRFALTEKTLSRFEDKALAILNEHGLSARLRAQGCTTVDLTFLVNPDARIDASRGTIPSWRTQVSSRGAESHPYPAVRRWS